MRTAIFVIARLGSTRLPRKMLAPAGDGRAIVEHLIDRMRLLRQSDLLALCTTTDPRDNELAGVARRCGIECFRGHPEDLLDRFLHAALRFDVEFFAVAEGDEVLADAEFVDQVIERYRGTGADFIWVDGLPIGAHTRGVRTGAARRVHELKLEGHGEGWTRYFTESGLFQIERIVIDDPEITEPPARMTLDYPEDLELVREIYARLYVPGQVFGLREVMRLLRAHPELLKINGNRVRDYAVHTANYPVTRLRLPTTGEPDRVGRAL